jgi:hypothetical protein
LEVPWLIIMSSGFDTGFISTFVYNFSQPIIALSLIYTLHKSSLYSSVLSCPCTLLYSPVLVLPTELSKSKSKSHWDWRSVSQQVLVSNPIWGSRPDNYYYYYVTVTVLLLWGALSDERVCLLYMLLALAIVVFIGSESLGTRDHILLSQIWDFPFRRLLRLRPDRKHRFLAFYLLL